MKKTVIIVVFIIILIMILSFFLIGNYFYNIALNPEKDKRFILGGYEETEEQIKKLEEQKKWLTDNSKDVYINSKNNGTIQLHAYEINNTDSDIWTIVIHGYMSEGRAMTRFAQKFVDKGYNVLILDLRGHGFSEGKYIGMGWHDRLDLLDWIDYVLKKNSNSKIILFGISMGASTIMMATGEELPNNVKLAIVDCGFTSAWDEFKHQLRELFDLSEFPILYAANICCKVNAGYYLKEASAMEQLKRSKTPTLFIHGDEDNFVPFEMLDKVFEVASCEKEKLIINKASHGLSSAVDPELYWNTIDRFIGNYLNT